MTDLKDAFARSAQNEPPLHASRDAILRSGRSRQLRRGALAAVGGLVVAAVVELPRLQNTGAVSAAAEGAATPSSDGTGKEPGVTPSLPAVAGLDVVKASRTAKLDAILQAVKAQLTAAGYAVPEFGADNSIDALFNAATPAGSYNMKLAVAQNGKDGAIVLSAGVLLADAAVAPECKATSDRCRTVQLPDGRTARFSDEASAGTVTRRLTVLGDTVTDVRFVQNAGAGLTLTDDLLLALATDPSLDLSTVPLLTADQRTAVDQALAAAATQSTPAPKPTGSDLKAG
jgi:hypothetical protein